MSKVLIVSPRFPPVNAADLHRVRVSLPHFPEFGWEPVVLSVHPTYVEEQCDALLLDTIPQGTLSRQVRALPAQWTRKVGLGDLSLRALPFLYAAGLKLIRQHQVDLIYFSTTAFAAMTLGRLWKKRTGVPFVLDMQDPWASDYYEDKPKAARPRKYWFSSRLHRTLEPWTMKETDGLVAVSGDYIKTLERRYPWLINRPSLTATFAASERDFEVIRANPQPNRFFARSDGFIHGVYVGRGGADMRRALEIIFTAMRQGLDFNPALFARLRVHFIGTDYAPNELAVRTVHPIAEACGVGAYVTEHPQRVPYFEALQLLLDADFLLVPGSDDAQYTASKIFPYIMAHRPLLAVFHERSTVCDLLHRTSAGKVLQFNDDSQTATLAREFQADWASLLASLPFAPPTDWQAFAPFTAREMTRQQCALFDQVLQAKDGHC
jgi:hypothetical protein